MLGIFPWALIIHILLVISDSIWMVMVVDMQQDYVRARLRSFLTLLIDDGIKINDASMGYYRIKYFADLKECAGQITKNNKFYHGIGKVNFNDGDSTYVLDISQDKFILGKIKSLKWVDPKEDADGDLFSTFETFSLSQANNQPIPIFVTITTNSASEE